MADMTPEQIAAKAIDDEMFRVQEIGTGRGIVNSDRLADAVLEALRKNGFIITRATADADGWQPIKSAPKEQTVIAYGSTGLRFMRLRETGQWENMMRSPRPTPKAWRPSPAPPTALPHG